MNRSPLPDPDEAAARLGAVVLVVGIDRLLVAPNDSRLACAAGLLAVICQVLNGREPLPPRRRDDVR